MIRIFFIFSFFFTALKTTAQKIATIPFEELLGGVILIKAKVGNYEDTLNFIFDTGNSHISLDSTVAKALGIETVESDRMVRGIGGMKKVKRTMPLALQLPGITIDSLNFNVNDYTLIRESHGVQIDGIIGFEFMFRYLIHVDFDKSILEIYKRGTPYKTKGRGYIWNFQLPYIPNTTIDYTDAKRQKAPVYIDCGAGLALLFSEQYVTDSLFLKDKKKPIIAQIEGVVGPAKTRLTTVKELYIGPYRFKKVPTYLYQDDDNILNYPNQVGLVGNEILRRFNWWLDYSKSQMHLTPNSFFAEPFDYSYTGLSIFLVDGLVEVSEIIPNSPATKAGFQIGDILLSIEEAIISNVKQARLLLQSANKPLKVIIIRENKPKILIIKPLSIL